ncbi:hypothetical protein B0H13DRAFT_2278946 [Mycena leptocephala]|nr:hypothetical protein B0H13DRAFT_2278946 [Mycena leptocephala]
MADEESLHQVDGLWFSNDTLVIRAENSIFRVSKSILAARSSVFEAMFEFPQSTSEGDWTAAKFYFMPPPSTVDFDVVLGILRLSHKYDVNYLYKRALMHLETVYPVDYNIYATLPMNAQPHQQQLLGFHLKAIPVLAEVGAAWLLPGAYYVVGTHPLASLLNAGPYCDRLPAGMRETCLPLAGIQHKALITVCRFPSKHSTCDNEVICNSGRLQLITFIIMERTAGPQDPLAEWNTGEWASIVDELCPECLSRCQNDNAVAFMEVWNALPGNCGMENWEGLLAKRKTVMG